MSDEQQNTDLMVAGVLDLIRLTGIGLIIPNTSAALLNRAADKMLRKRTEEAREIFLSELRKGEKHIFDCANPDEIVPIFHRYSLAAREGQARINLRLMAKVMCGQAITPSLHTSEFLTYADIISSLQRNEIVFLGTMIKFTRAGIQLPKEDDSEQFYGVEQSVEIELRRSLPGSAFFPDLESVNSVELAILRTGFLRHVTSLASGGNLYAPSPLLIRLSELADFEDAMREEGINFST